MMGTTWVCAFAAAMKAVIQLTIFAGESNRGHLKALSVALDALKKTIGWAFPG